MRLEGAKEDQPGWVPAWELAVVKLLLVVLPVAMAMAGTQTVRWPIVSWHMYSGKSYEVPGPTITDTVLRATTADGEAHLLRLPDLMPDGRVKGATPLIDGAFGPQADPAVCAELVATVGHVVGGNVREVELVEWHWDDVDPWKSPMLDPTRPDREIPASPVVCPTGQPG